jgi:hypothetical protein
MHAGSEAVFGGQPAEQGDQLLALAGVQGRAELGFVLGRGVHDLAQGAAAVAGEVEGAHSSVGRNRLPFEQAALLERVDERDHAAGGDLQRLRQRLLGLPFGCGDVSQEDDLARVEVEAGHPLSPQTRRVEADLGEQEGGTRNA